MKSSGQSSQSSQKIIPTLNMPSDKELNELAKRELADASAYLVFEWDGTSTASVLASNLQVR